MISTHDITLSIPFVTSNLAKFNLLGIMNACWCNQAIFFIIDVSYIGRHAVANIVQCTPQQSAYGYRTMLAVHMLRKQGQLIPSSEGIGRSHVIVTRSMVTD